MKIFAVLISSSIIFSGFFSCQTKPVKIIFVSTLKDTATGIKETKIYKLKKKTVNSDFDYRKLNDIDGNVKNTLNLKNLLPIFEPINGQYNYYQFISTFKGTACCDGEAYKDFHDILIVKTDSEKKILDAYQYTLEWAELPLQLDLYKSNMKNILLENDLNITLLKLTRKDYWDEKDRIHKENGRLKLE